MSKVFNVSTLMMASLEAKAKATPGKGPQPRPKNAPRKGGEFAKEEGSTKKALKRPAAADSASRKGSATDETQLADERPAKIIKRPACRGLVAAILFHK